LCCAGRASLMRGPCTRPAPAGSLATHKQRLVAASAGAIGLGLCAAGARAQAFERQVDLLSRELSANMGAAEGLGRDRLALQEHLRAAEQARPRACPRVCPSPGTAPRPRARAGLHARPRRQAQQPVSAWGASGHTTMRTLFKARRAIELEPCRRQALKICLKCLARMGWQVSARLLAPKPSLEGWRARAQVRHAAERQREGLQRRLASAEAALRAAQSGLAEAQHERQARARPSPCPALMLAAFMPARQSCSSRRPGVAMSATLTYLAGCRVLIAAGLLANFGCLRQALQQRLAQEAARTAELERLLAELRAAHFRSLTAARAAAHGCGGVAAAAGDAAELAEHEAALLRQQARPHAWRLRRPAASTGSNVCIGDTRGVMRVRIALLQLTWDRV